MSERLALEGGTPVRSSTLPYGRQSVDEADADAVLAVLRSTWLTTGPRVSEFEAAFAAAVGARHAVAVSSGTAALHAAVHAAGLGPGDELVTTPLTFVASANCALYVGARPVFADVDPGTLNLSPASVAERAGPRARAIVAVDYAGQPADLDELSELAARRGLVLIEDAAHSLGAEYRGRRVGGIARLTTFSTHPVKAITTAEGGVVTTDDDDLARRLRCFRNHGISTDLRQRQEQDTWAYEMVALGYNYRLSDLQCALGLSQLPRLAGWLARRAGIAARYAAALGAHPALEVPRVLDDRTSAWHIYPLRLRLERLRVGRDQFLRALRAERIGANVHYMPVPLHPYYRGLGYRPEECPVACREAERLVTLPIYPAMSEGDVDDVIAAVRKVADAYARSAA